MGVGLASILGQETRPCRPRLQLKDPACCIGRTDAEAEAPILWPPDAKSQLTGKDPDAGKIEGKRSRGRQRMRW